MEEEVKKFLIKWNKKTVKKENVTEKRLRESIQEAQQSTVRKSKKRKQSNRNSPRNVSIRQSRITVLRLNDPTECEPLRWEKTLTPSPITVRF